MDAGRPRPRGRTRPNARRLTGGDRAPLGGEEEESSYAAPLVPLHRTARPRRRLDARACAETPLPAAPREAPPTLAVSDFPPEDAFGSWEGQLHVCKDGTGPTGTNFTFDWVLKRVSDGGSESTESLVVPLGSCALALNVGATGVPRYRADVTMRIPPIGFPLTDIDVTYGSNTAISPPTPTIKLGARGITGVGVTNDFGAVVSFTTDFDPPAFCTRTQLQGWATTLDSFNNGPLGPGKCSD